MSDRPRGGRRHEDFPDVVTRDEEILEYLCWADPGPKSSRNVIAKLFGTEPRKVSYALDRLRKRGLVEHVPHGNEGHGYWRIRERSDQQ